MESSSSSSSSITQLPTPVKGRSDWREYRAIRLANGMEVLLVQDQKLQTHTACSVTVNVGASSDPRSMSGLAHFVEHMCFLGSGKSSVMVRVSSIFCKSVVSILVYFILGLDTQCNVCFVVYVYALSNESQKNIRLRMNSNRI